MAPSSSEVQCTLMGPPWVSSSTLGTYGLQNLAGSLRRPPPHARGLSSSCCRRRVVLWVAWVPWVLHRGWGVKRGGVALTSAPRSRAHVRCAAWRRTQQQMSERANAARAWLTSGKGAMMTRAMRGDDVRVRDARDARYDRPPPPSPTPHRVRAIERSSDRASAAAAAARACRSCAGGGGKR